MHILTTIWRSKDNQTFKFGKLIEHNMRNIFLEKTYTKWAGESVPRSFSKNKKVSITLDLKFYTAFFIVCQVESYQSILKPKLQTTRFYNIKSLCKKQKRFATSLPISLSTWFLKKNISQFISYRLTKFCTPVAFTSWNIGEYIL